MQLSENDSCGRGRITRIEGPLLFVTAEDLTDFERMNTINNPGTQTAI